MVDRYFLKNPYIGASIGASGDAFLEDFIAYLNDALITGRESAMSDRDLFLQGGRQALSEVLDELREEAFHG